MTAVPRFGVEEEFLVVDAETRALSPRAAHVVAAATPLLGDRVGGEITTLQVETRTAPCHDAAELHRQLVEARRALQAAAGLRAVATATPVLGDAVPPPMTQGPRQSRGIATFRGLHDELAICALHVHVELADRDLAVRVSNRLRAHLPLLVALTANSPFWAERDTGYASWRTMTWQRWPVSGPPPVFASAADYDARVGQLLDAGALVDAGTLFWDIRLSAKQPTIEIRAADVPPTAAESAAFAALVRAMVTTAATADSGPRPTTAGSHGRTTAADGRTTAADGRTTAADGRATGGSRGGPAPGGGLGGGAGVSEHLRVAYWRAARDGFGGHGVDPVTGALVATAEAARRLVEAVAPALDAAGDRARVDDWLARLEKHGDGATRQRRAAARHGRLADVVDDLLDAERTFA